MRRTERRVLDYIRRHSILAPHESAVVAVSGGPDSTALLLILDRIADRLGIRLCVAHFDHRLRGKAAAAADLQYVEALAASLQLPVANARTDVRARARRKGESLEDAARRARYLFLKRCARKAGCAVIVTGHTIDDQAETVLLHITRGSGLNGLAGIRPRSSWPFGSGPDVARPILSLRRADTERYCAEAGLAPREDETNQLFTADRNRIRLKVLPELQTLNPRVSDALARLADSASIDAAYLAGEANQRFQAAAQITKDSIVFRKNYLAALPTALAVRMIRQACEEASGIDADLETIHLEEVLAMINKPPQRLSLPNGVSVESDSHSIHFSMGMRRRSGPIPEAVLSTPGTTRVAGWSYNVTRANVASSTRTRDPLFASFDPAIIHGKLVVRSRRRGDSLRPSGLGGRKKLQDIFVDAKVPVAHRDSIPLICDDGGILWVVGHCVDERAHVWPTAKEVIHIAAFRKI